VCDPTGAGDTFAAVSWGYLTATRQSFGRGLQTSVISERHGVITVEAFSLDRLRILDYKEVEERFRAFKQLTHFEDNFVMQKSLCRIDCSTIRASVACVGPVDRMAVWLCHIGRFGTEVKRYYQEGVAAWSMISKKAFVSFQKA